MTGANGKKNAPLWERWWPLLVIAGLAVLPLVLTSAYLRSILVVIGINVLVTVGLCLLMGYAGQISLGHAAFYAIGAYTSGILSATYGVNPWLAMLVAMALTALVAVVIGLPTLKLEGNYLALATLGFGVIVYFLLTQWSGLTGGPSGLPGIPYLRLFGTDLKNDFQYYYLVWAVAVLGILVARNVVNSRTGRALRAVSASEVAAETLGVHTFSYKLQVFVLSAVYTSVAGSLYAHYVTFVSPAPFSFMGSISFVVMAVVGGLASVWGPLFGVSAVTVLVEVLRVAIPKLLGHSGGEVEIVVYGLILVVIMIFLPEGLVRGLLNLWEEARRRAQREAEQTPVGQGG